MAEQRGGYVPPSFHDDSYNQPMSDPNIPQHVCLFYLSLLFLINFKFLGRIN